MDTQHKVMAWIKAGVAGAVIAAGIVACGGDNFNDPGASFTANVRG